MLSTGAQDGPDPVQRVARTAAVTGGGLLHPAAHVVHDLGAQLDDVKRIKHSGGVFQLLVQAFLYPWNGSSVATFTPSRNA